MDLQHLRRFAKAGDVPDVVRVTFERAKYGTDRREVPTSILSGSTGGNRENTARELGSPDASGCGAGSVEGEKVMVSGTPDSKSTPEDLTSRNSSPSALETITADEPRSASATTLVHATASNSIPVNSRTRTDDVTDELFLIVGSTNAISSVAVGEELSANVNDAVICSIRVPRLAPTSQEQAALWSSQYWPTVYKKSNPFGPHPSIVTRTEQEIQGDVEKWMDLASEVAHQADVAGSGEAVGVVIVERKNGIGRPVAVAGDARWVDWSPKGPGNVTAHAALRAIAMVAAGVKATDKSEQSTATVLGSIIQPEIETIPADQSICIDSTSTFRLETKNIGAEQLVKAVVESSPRDSQEVTWNAKPDTDVMFMNVGREKQVEAANIFQDKPVLAAEKGHCDLLGTEAGYLCHELEIYCTHEPCVMCSMAILHSRFGKMIFQHRMPRTGGMCADGDLGHGLFWRKELNWTLLAWQWMQPSNGQKLEQACFHA